jgi:transposase
MKVYLEAAVEKAMKIQEVILRAIDKQITWLQAAEILRVSARQLRRWRAEWEKLGYDGLFDRRLGKPSPKRVALETVAEVLRLYREKYAGFSVQHFHEKLQEEHKIQLSHTWVKKALQGAGLVEKEAKRGVHRKKRERRPIPGLPLHIDASNQTEFKFRGVKHSSSEGSGLSLLTFDSTTRTFLMCRCYITELNICVRRVWLEFLDIRSTYATFPHVVATKQDARGREQMSTNSSLPRLR